MQTPHLATSLVLRIIPLVADALMSKGYAYKRMGEIRDTLQDYV